MTNKTQKRNKICEIFGHQYKSIPTSVVCGNDFKCDRCGNIIHI